MLFMRMDLLNYQYLDKMNNNIGILCYEGNAFMSPGAFCRLCFLPFVTLTFIPLLKPALLAVRYLAYSRLCEKDGLF